MHRFVDRRPNILRYGGTCIVVLVLVFVITQMFAGASSGSVRALVDGSPQAQAGTIRIIPSSVTVNEGENVTVDVRLEDVAGYYGIDFRFSFDPSLVSVPSGQVTPLWEVFDSGSHWIIRNQADNENGNVWYAVTNMNPAEPFTGTGRICSITFSGLVSGTTALDFYYAKGSTRDGEGLYPTQVDGEIVVGQAVNDPPVANDDAATTDENTPVAINVTANDFDPDGTIDPTTVSIVSGPTHGSVSVDASGVVTYTPAASYHGIYSFTYTVNDNDGATSNVATVTVTVNPEHGTAAIVTLAPVSKTISAGESITYTVWVTDTGGNGWDGTAEADYAIESGAGGSWADNVYTSEIAGAWTVTATVDDVDDTASLTVTHAPATSITLTPASYAVTTGDAVTYTVTADDGYGNNWDVTAEAIYTITHGAGGIWTDNVYTSQVVGTWTVIATWNSLSDTATLQVITATVAEISLSPATAVITAGHSIAYTVWATDTCGNGWDATSGTYFVSDSGAGGSWAANVYTGERAGVWRVTAVYGMQSDTASLTVTHAVAASIGLSPQVHAATAGSPVTYTVWATDAYGNGWDVTSRVHFFIDSAARGSWAGNAYTSEVAGVWTVVAIYSGKSDTAILTVINPAPTLTSLSPISATADGPAFILTVNGTNFVAGSTVHWNGALRTTTFISSTQVRAAITALDIATVGVASVTVVNPTPGGGTSNALPFEIIELGPAPPMYIYLPLVSRNATP